MILNPLDLHGPEFLALYLLILATSVACVLWLRSTIGADTASHGALGPLDLAYLSGGPGRVGDVTLVDLLGNKFALLSGDGRKIDVASPSGVSPTLVLPLTAKTFRVGPGIYTRAEFQKAIKPLVDGVQSKLELAGLSPNADARTAYRWSVLVALGLPILLGIAKLIVGLDRHKPVEFLIVLLVISALIFVASMVAPRATRAGRAALAESSERNARAARAPRSGELAMAVSLGGLAVLAGTDYEILHKVNRGDSSGCGGGGDGGGGGGCGGGCGGCGG